MGNVGKLVTVVGPLQYKPEDLANGAADLIEEVQNTKITGEEEAFSHIDLVDFAGNVEGAQQAYASLRPGLQKIDGNLVTQLDGQFQTVLTTLDGYRDAARPRGLQGVDTAIACRRRGQAHRGDPAAAPEPVHRGGEGRLGELTTGDAESSGAGFSRRRMLAGAAAAGAGGLVLGAAGGGAAGYAMASAPVDENDTVDLRNSYPFYGQMHQGGIETPPQRHSVFMTFRLADEASRTALQTLLARWSAAAAVLQQGKTVGTVQPDVDVQPPSDTGEAFGLSPASLTVTIGLGPAVFGDRFGLTSRKPALFAALPPLNGDNLDPNLTGGDLSIQACADDPQVCYHAVRNLTRLGRSIVAPHWAVLGFGRASAGAGQQTPRNLLGFKDGTRNVSSDEDYQRFVWVHNSDQPWMNGGTYQVVRKIRMILETWDTDRIGNQQRIFGRHKENGAPLTGTAEFDNPDFAARDATGTPVIDPVSHVALAAHEHNNGVMIRRRSYNYTDGLDPNGQLNAGLLFISYQNDPGHFAAIQNRLGAHDLLNEYIRHIGSAIFAVPPAPEQGHYVGQPLFA